MKPNSTYKQLRARLVSNSGETLVETLVSVLISSLALLLLAIAIGTSVNIVTQSRERMDTLYESESNMVDASETDKTKKKDGSYTSNVLITVPDSLGTDNSRDLEFYQAGDEDIYLYKRGE